MVWAGWEIIGIVGPMAIAVGGANFKAVSNLTKSVRDHLIDQDAKIEALKEVGQNTNVKVARIEGALMNGSAIRGAREVSADTRYLIESRESPGDPLISDDPPVEHVVFIDPRELDPHSEPWDGTNRRADQPDPDQSDPPNRGRRLGPREQQPPPWASTSTLAPPSDWDGVERRIPGKHGGKSD